MIETVTYRPNEKNEPPRTPPKRRRRRQPLGEKPKPFTKREREVLFLRFEGSPRAEVADILGVSRQTVRTAELRARRKVARRFDLRLPNDEESDT